jgi:hypothetical protein
MNSYVIIVMIKIWKNISHFTYHVGEALHL